MIESPVKLCRGKDSCGKVLHISNFYKGQNICKSCFKKRYPCKSPKKPSNLVTGIIASKTPMKFKSCDFSKEGNPNKNLLQRILYSWSGVKGSATIVSGIDVLRHIRDYEDLICYDNKKQGKIDIVEKDYDIYKSILDQLLLYDGKSDVSVIHSDIINVRRLYRFVDADLTGSITTCLPLFMILFMKMTAKKAKRGKAGNILNNALICTYCKRTSKNIRVDERKFDIKRNLEKITGLLWKELPAGDQIPLLEVTQGSYLKRTNYQSDKYSCIAFSYRFGKHPPMVSLIIKWK